MMCRRAPGTPRPTMRYVASNVERASDRRVTRYQRVPLAPAPGAQFLARSATSQPPRSALQLFLDLSACEWPVSATVVQWAGRARLRCSRRRLQLPAAACSRPLWRAYHAPGMRNERFRPAPSVLSFGVVCMFGVVCIPRTPRVRALGLVVSIL